MKRTPFIVFGLFAALCLVVIPIWAFGKEGNPSAGTVQVAPEDQEAKELFAGNCGPCHTLAAAGSDGVVGPNLDEILVPTGANAAEQYEGIYTRTLTAISCGVQGRMPKGIVIGEEAEEVARFVGVYAAQIGKGPTQDTDSAPTPEVGDCPTATD